MLTAVESIIDGTWGSGAPPREFIDFFLMYEMRWSWDELRATPEYVQRFCYDFRQAAMAYEAEPLEKAKQSNERQGWGRCLHSYDPCAGRHLRPPRGGGAPARAARP